MSSRVTGVGTQSSSDTLSAAEYNDAAGGWIQVFTVTSNQGSITSAVDLTGLTTASFTVPLRKYRFWFDLTFTSTVASDVVQVKLLEDGADLKRWDFPMNANSGSHTSVRGDFLYSPTNAAHIYKLQAARGDGGTGTITLTASAVGASPSYPGQFAIEDAGPQ